MTETSNPSTVPHFHGDWQTQKRLRLTNHPIITIFRGKAWIAVQGKINVKNNYLYKDKTLLGPILRTICDGGTAPEKEMHKICLFSLRPGASIPYQDIEHLCAEHATPSSITVLRTNNKVIRPDLLLNE